jgi:hypothetical protein
VSVDEVPAVVEPVVVPLGAVLVSSTVAVDDGAAVAALPSLPSASAAGANATQARSATTNDAAPAMRTPTIRLPPSLTTKQLPPQIPR